MHRRMGRERVEKVELQITHIYNTLKEGYNFQSLNSFFRANRSISLQKEMIEMGVIRQKSTRPCNDRYQWIGDPPSTKMAYNLCVMSNLAPLKSKLKERKAKNDLEGAEGYRKAVEKMTTDLLANGIDLSSKKPVKTDSMEIEEALGAEHRVYTFPEAPVKISVGNKEENMVELLNSIIQAQSKHELSLYEMKRVINALRGSAKDSSRYEWWQTLIIAVTILMAIGVVFSSVLILTR